MPEFHDLRESYGTGKNAVQGDLRFPLQVRSFVVVRAFHRERVVDALCARAFHDGDASPEDVPLEQDGDILEHHQVEVGEVACRKTFQEFPVHLHPQLSAFLPGQGRICQHRDIEIAFTVRPVQCVRSVEVCEGDGKALAGFADGCDGGILREHGRSVARHIAAFIVCMGVVVINKKLYNIVMAETPKNKGVGPRLYENAAAHAAGVDIKHPRGTAAGRVFALLNQQRPLYVKAVAAAIAPTPPASATTTAPPAAPASAEKPAKKVEPEKPKEDETKTEKKAA